MMNFTRTWSSTASTTRELSVKKSFDGTGWNMAASINAACVDAEYLRTRRTEVYCTENGTTSDLVPASVVIAQEMGALFARLAIVSSM